MTRRELLRLGTRRSRLALVQAELATEALAAVGIEGIEIVPLATRGDAISARQPRGAMVEGDGQFTHELERALLDGAVDLVVHSYKDLPTEPVDGLTIAAVLERADARDCLLTAGRGGVDDVPFGGRIGTSSVRRAAQLAATRSDLVAVPIRGNVETRLRRLAAGEYDGLVLAAAGLDRLGVRVPPAARLPYDVMLPAPAQGALALQARAGDSDLVEAVGAANHASTRTAVEAERSLLRRIGGGCLAPLGALGTVNGARLTLRAAYEDRTGAFARTTVDGPIEDMEAVVERAAHDVMAAVASA